MCKGTGLAARQLLAVSFITHLSLKWCFDQPLQGPQTPARSFISTETIMSIPMLSRVPGQLLPHWCGITPTIWCQQWITYVNVILGPATVGSVHWKEQRESKDQDSSQQKMWAMWAAHFFQTNSITPEWNPNLLPKHLLGNDSDINGQSPIFTGGRRKGTTKRKSGGGNEVTRSSWELVGPVSDFPSAWTCCTCQSNTAKSTVKHSLSCHLNWSGSNLRASSLLNRRSRK